MFKKNKSGANTNIFITKKLKTLKQFTRQHEA
jgi:hypothetical protein